MSTLSLSMLSSLERCIIAESNTDEILKLCAQLICIMIEMDRGAGTSATPRVPLRAPPSGEVPQQQHATLILGPPSRLPYIQATMRQLQEKGFPNILWLRLPDPFELDELLKKRLPPQRRVMALWRTTVLPAVLQVCDTYTYTGAMVVEDTVLLRQDVTYSEVASEIEQRNAPAGVWGYGNY